MAWAAGPALATLEGKITIAAGAPSQEPVPDFPREEPLCQGGIHMGGRWDLAGSFWGGGGLGLGGSVGALGHWGN